MAEPVKLRPRPVSDAASVDVFASEDALALWFAERHVEEYRSVTACGMYRYNGRFWERDREKRHWDDARRLCRELGAKRQFEKNETRRLGQSSLVAGVIKHVTADPRMVLSPDAFDADRWALNTPGGIVDLRSGTIKPHAGDYVTKMTSVRPARGKPKGFLRFMDQVFQGDKVMISFVRRMLGYALTGETREQIVAFFHGKGANGKSTLLELVMALVGSYAIKAPTSMLMAQRGDRHPTDIAQLRGVRLAVANEISEGQYWDEARLKELTGDTKLTARFMRQDFFQFDATHKFLVAANNRPQMSNMDHAMERRLVLVPFDVTFEGTDRDPQMLTKLMSEGEAILAWAIEGAVEWYDVGLQIPDRVREASEEYAEAMDSLGLWLAECCAVTHSHDDYETGDALYRSYRAWKERRGERSVSLTRWGEQMKGRGPERYRSNGIKYRGVKLRDEELVRLDALRGQSSC